ncbi:uncharacterized protein Z518_07812 [Rhinocladiella mackenziei CBS 650.93]|uniref:Rhinocladiella mackenziei CBS 650.93 unplaced genomic scaffold supercont1.5, whole genome shotgun sequence n=1 Tax=Rhinocladiella mackenziei CBS 650.93 TaxID=1442369 RepID=A0A0D2H1C7_9EURO|nr:uncharacterized protein Z518_07812 [Rhinocladiella mackenziei CBS 650.93]KIX04258.1 hypothetical protein Z518_07812 [Rhinocladiella mackenziei CBS 650.93]
MGNICSKSANKPDNFSTPGRTLGSSAQPKPNSTTVPPKITASTPGRALGGRDGASSSEDARSAAAKAAEERASKANKTGGKLSAQLNSQKKQTQNQLLNSRSEEERLARDADERVKDRNWN